MVRCHFQSICFSIYRRMSHIPRKKVCKTSLMPSRNEETVNRYQNNDVNWMNLNVEKSPNDYKQYRVIDLPNKLKALLICDLQSGESFDKDGQQLDNVDPETPEDDTRVVSDQDDDDNSSGCESDDGISSDGGEEASGDHKQAKEKSERMAAAALCVGIGSFSDPVAFPGMAHFLEHMVFMGSEKYPNENAFDEFITKHGGQSNAYTNCEQTVFFFDIERKYFMKALDIWAQFFINPLLKEDSVDREVKAVDSEFQMSLPSDNARVEQLLGSFAKKGHPISKFMYGNLKSLKTKPQEDGINPYDRLHEFNTRHYSSHYMTLVVQSKESLDTLQQWVTDIFSPIPNNSQQQPDFSKEVKPFDTEDFCKLYRVVPVKDKNQLEITWALPNLMTQYRQKPLNYLSWLIGHEGKGSLMSFLRKKLWALKLAAGFNGVGFDYNSTSSQFNVSITLTDSGLDNLEQVLTAVFEYLQMLSDVGPQQWIFEEIQTIEANDFRWKEQCDPIDNVDDLVVNMHLYPPEHYITGDVLLFDFDPELIAECQQMIQPSKANVVLLSKTHQGSCDLIEPWFQTKYGKEEFGKEQMNKWETCTPGPEFHLPEKNQYIAKDFSLKPSDMADAQKKLPTLIHSGEYSKLYYKKDDKFKVPKAYCYFYLISPLVNVNAENRVLFGILKNILEQNLSEVAYAASVAQLSYDFKILDFGLEIKMSGFNEKLPLLFHTVIDHLTNFTVTEDLFLAVQSELSKSYYNLAIKPRELEKEVRLSILLERYWPITDLSSAVNLVTREQLLKVYEEFKQSVFIEGYIHGNITDQESKDLLTYLMNKLKPQHKMLPTTTQMKVHELPRRESTVRVSSFNKADANSVVTNYFQFGPANVHQSVLNELLLFRMDEPCFNFLRTKEQLGYAVFCTNRVTSGTLGLSVTVQYQADKFSVSHIENKITEFLDEKFAELINKEMNEEEFQHQVEALLAFKKLDDTHMSEESNRNWEEVTQQTYLFDRLQKEISILEKLTLTEFRQWYENLVRLGSGDARKLSCQVIGHIEKSNESELSPNSSDVSKTSHLNYLSCDTKDLIQEINSFRASCSLYPFTKIIN